MVFAIWWEHTAISWPEWLLSYPWIEIGSLSETSGCRHIMLLNPSRLSISFALLLSNLVFLFTCLEQEKETKQESNQRGRVLVKILNALTCVSRTQGHSSTPWLQHPTPNKPSSLWAACYSQCEFPNGHNGGQDHLLLLGGEVCIRLQLRRKTSWCL